MRWLVALVTWVACQSDGGSGRDASVADAAAEDPTAADLLNAISSCSVIGGPYAPDMGSPATIDMCGKTGAVFWKADLDIDCDGKTTAECNLQTDPAYQNQTAATDSNGDPLDATILPYVVLPSPSSRFDFRTHKLAMGSVIVVIYLDRVEYGVAGDTGPVEIIGEASYAMAELLGIDPDPATGGADDGVAYIAFTSAIVDVIEDHAEATRVGIAHAQTLLNSTP